MRNLSFHDNLMDAEYKLRRKYRALFNRGEISHDCFVSKVERIKKAADKRENDILYYELTE